MDREAFYSVVRSKIGTLNQGQVDGFERYMNEAERRGTALDRFAYVLATVFWETARTMQPVKEAYWLSETWRKNNLRYYPWYGRGDIQLTWEENYRRAGQAIGVDLIKDPNAALDPANAVRIAFEGMEGGWFTGKELGDYLDGVDENDKEDLREFANARRIVNGTDKQIEIGKLALTFEKALRAASYSGVPSKSSPAQPEIKPVEKDLTPVESTNKANKGALTGLGGGTLGGAIIYLWSLTGSFPVEWATDPQAVVALTTVASIVSGAVGSWIGAYRARDYRIPE